MNRLAELRKRLKDRRLYIVAKAIGVSYSSLRKIFTGETGNPSILMVEKLEAYLDGREIPNGETQKVG